MALNVMPGNFALPYTMMDNIYKIHLLPKSHPDGTIWAALISSQKVLRLASLQISPESFSSTYDREVAFSSRDWEARLANPLASTFVATECPANSSTTPINNITDFVNGQWVGSAVLYGPIGQAATSKPSSQSENPTRNNTESSTTLQFEIVGVFVLPAVRGIGIGKALVNAAVAHGKTLGEDARVREIIVWVSALAHNVKAVRLYEQLGFQVTELEGSGSASESQNKRTVLMQLRHVLHYSWD